MKRKVNVITVIIAIMLTLTIGYAIFSRTININGSARVYGEFEITPDCSMGIESEYLQSAIASNAILSFDSYTEKGYNNTSCTVLDKEHMSYTVQLEYPGALRYVTFTFENTGTVDAKIDTASYSNLVEVCEYNSSDDSLVGCGTSTNIMDSSGDVSDVNYYSQFGQVGFLDEDKNFIGVDDPDFANYIEEDDEDYVVKLPVGHTLVMFAWVRWNPSNTRSDRYFTISADVDVPFAQLRAN